MSKAQQSVLLGLSKFHIKTILTVSTSFTTVFELIYDMAFLFYDTGYTFANIILEFVKIDFMNITLCISIDTVDSLHKSSSTTLKIICIL